jgi:hypothetical protein
MKSVMSRLGVTGVVVAAALTTAIATAGSASADRASGGYFNDLGACNQAGHNVVQQGNANSWNCALVTNGGPHQGQYHLILFT